MIQLNIEGSKSILVICFYTLYDLCSAHNLRWLICIEHMFAVHLLYTVLTVPWGRSKVTHLDAWASGAESSETKVSHIVDQVGCDTVPFAILAHPKQSIGHQVEIVVKVQITSHRIEQIDGNARTALHLILLALVQSTLCSKVGEYLNQIIAHIGVDLCGEDTKYKMKLQNTKRLLLFLGIKYIWGKK